jgi:hypothetical protein
MGQYYIIVNLNRREYISPETFGDGSKLLEFGCSGNGVMMALALLTASGNGRGLGDIARESYETKPDTFEPRTWERIESEWLSDYDHNSQKVTDKRTIRHRSIVPSAVGSWAGDPIVTTGDYADQTKHMTTEEYLAGLEWKFRGEFQYQNKLRTEQQPRQASLSEAEFLETNPHLTYNLYDHAYRHFTDAGAHLKFAISEYGYGRVTAASFDQTVRELLHRMLEGAYAPKIMIGAGKSKRWLWRADWMTPELIDSFLRRWDDPEDFKRAKKWLQRQLLELWQREFIKAYRLVGGKVKFYDDKARKVLREHAGIEWYSSSLSRIKMPPILPERAFLEAAINVQEDKSLHSATPSRPLREYEQYVVNALTTDDPTRDRVIDLDGPNSKGK